VPAARERLSTIPKLCRDDCSLAGFGVFGEVVLHAGLDSAAAGVDARTSTSDICLAGFDDIYIAQQSLLASLGKLRKVILDALLDPTGTGFGFGAILLDFCATGLAHFWLLRYGSGASKQKGASEKPENFPFHAYLYSSAIPASCRPLK
jgi:hypothetical protein